VREFAGQSNVVFGDVNLSEAPGTGSRWSPGSGGWPTIRYFNAETGYEGAKYIQKTSSSMCDELGNINNMRAYVNDKASKPCLISDPSKDCSDQERAFISTWSAKPAADVEKEHVRLQKILAADSKTAAAQVKWMKQRAAILKQLASGDRKDL